MTDHDKALVERLERIVFITEGEEISDAISRIKAQAAEIEKLRGLLSRNIDPDPCQLDHHGYCQTHYLEEDCSVAAARAALGETK